MRKHICNRCREEHAIPTHQIVRFDMQVQLLCKECWEGFRAWFFTGNKILHKPAVSTEPDDPRWKTL